MHALRSLVVALVVQFDISVVTDPLVQGQTPLLPNLDPSHFIGTQKAATDLPIRLKLRKDQSRY